MSDIVVELTARVRQDYKDLPKPVQAKFKKQRYDSSPKIPDTPRSTSIAYEAAAITGSSISTILTVASFAAKKTSTI